MLYLTVPIRAERVPPREWPCATGTVACVLHHNTLQRIVDRFIPEVKGHATCIKSALVLALCYAG